MTFLLSLMNLVLSKVFAMIFFVCIILLTYLFRFSYQQDVSQVVPGSTGFVAMIVFFAFALSFSINIIYEMFSNPPEVLTENIQIVEGTYVKQMDLLNLVEGKILGYPVTGTAAGACTPVMNLLGLRHVIKSDLTPGTKVVLVTFHQTAFVERNSGRSLPGVSFKQNTLTRRAVGRKPWDVGGHSFSTEQLISEDAPAFNDPVVLIQS